jgi:hypothetical protein
MSWLVERVGANPSASALLSGIGKVYGEWGGRLLAEHADLCPEDPERMASFHVSLAAASDLGWCGRTQDDWEYLSQRLHVVEPALLAWVILLWRQSECAHPGIAAGLREVAAGLARLGDAQERSALMSRLTARGVVSLAPNTPATVDEVRALAISNEGRVRRARPEATFGVGKARFAPVGVWFDRIVPRASSTAEDGLGDDRSDPPEAPVAPEPRTPRRPRHQRPRHVPSLEPRPLGKRSTNHLPSDDQRRESPKPKRKT